MDLSYVTEDPLWLIIQEASACDFFDGLKQM